MFLTFGDDVLQSVPFVLGWHIATGRFRGPSGRAPFSDEGGFTFSEAPFEGTLHEGLKVASPSEGFKGASPSEGGP